MKDKQIYVGQRVFISVSLINRKTRVQAGGLAPTLSFKKPDKSVVDVGVMTEDDPGSGVYGGSYVVDVKGTWQAEIAVPSPLESVLRSDDFYVSS